MSDKYEAGQDPYCYPGTSVLINLPGITDQIALTQAERLFTGYRIGQLLPEFAEVTLATLRDIHLFLFQDLYPWAGQIRSVDISKGGTRFAHCRFIEAEANKLFDQLAQENYLFDLPHQEFTRRLAHYYSEVNVIHPFRDGNGRAQRVFFEILAIDAGYQIHWQVIDVEQWLAANVAAYHCRFAPLEALFGQAVTTIAPD